MISLVLLRNTLNPFSHLCHDSQVQRIYPIVLIFSRKNASFDNISGRERRKCETERRNLLSEDQPANVPPSCDFHGYYSRIQCDPFTQECWCADRYGEETNGTRIKGIANCGKI